MKRDGWFRTLIRKWMDVKGFGAFHLGSLSVESKPIRLYLSVYWFTFYPDPEKFYPRRFIFMLFALNLYSSFLNTPRQCATVFIFRRVFLLFFASDIRASFQTFCYVMHTAFDKRREQTHLKDGIARKNRQASAARLNREHFNARAISFASWIDTRLGTSSDILSLPSSKH